MSSQKQGLVAISSKFQRTAALTPMEVEELLSFEPNTKPHPVFSWLKNVAVPLSLLLGALMTMYREEFVAFSESLPSWTNLSPRLLEGVNYFWNFLSEPIEYSNILFHIPNLAFYSFGIFGLKALVEKIEHKSWIHTVLTAQETVRKQTLQGKIHWQLPVGHSLLFVGKGDFIARQIALNQGPNGSVTISEVQPDHTVVWNHYSIDSLYEGLKETMLRSSGSTAGEYIFFPVQDDQIFLPGPKAYDLSPHKLDILCQNIRVIEKECEWKTKPIFILGDRFHQSFVQSEDKKRALAKSQDTITLESLTKKYSEVQIFDPTDIVLKHILRKSRGRKISFRATKDGIAEYKKRFYERLELLGYEPTRKGMLTIGYDLYEDQTEQQTLSRTVNDYYPVVLSKSVRDALVRNGHKESEFLYVPDLVLQTMNRAAEQQ